MLSSGKLSISEISGAVVSVMQVMLPWSQREEGVEEAAWASIDLKGPKLEIFGFRVFSQIRLVWVGDLGTRQKNSKF
jgi:hypothetical protein